MEQLLFSSVYNNGLVIILMARYADSPSVGRAYRKQLAFS